VEWKSCVVDNGFSVLHAHMMKRNESIFYHLMEDLNNGWNIFMQRDCWIIREVKHFISL
jgi:hypothetical protein